ncbi:MAG: hypothetical protein QM534_14535 [Sediminibacterium sp.]|nr:hypothetical protein [Sediminibacterium sp.]
MEIPIEQTERLHRLILDKADRGAGFTSIEKELIESGEDALLVAVALQKAKKEIYEANRKSGLKKLGAGVLLLGIGFIITCIKFHSNESLSLIMYGFTSVGLVLVFWGLYEIIG